MSMVLCPFCLGRFEYPLTRSSAPDAGSRAGASNGTAAASCPGCSESIPQLYLDSGLGCPNDIVLSLGRRGNGKTTLLTALLGTLVMAPDLLHHGLFIGTYTPGEGRRTATGQGPIAWARRAYNGFMEQGTLPMGTVLAAEPIPFYICDLPPIGRKRYTRRNLFLFDIGGEAFDDVATFSGGAQYCVLSRVLWVIVSLDEGGEAEREAAEQYGGISGSMWDLLNVYAESRARVLRSHPEWKPGPQALLVVFTKADAHDGRLPGLDRYLEQQSYSSREERAQLSRMLRTWMERDQGAQGVLNYAGRNFARIEFCAVSATGGRTAAGERMDRRPRPCRIFDPLLWTWELTDELGRGRIWKRGRA